MFEPISFRIVLWAPDAYLKPFLVTRSPSSFLPLDGSTTTISEPVGPVRVHVLRRIHADPRSTFVIVIGQLITSHTQSAILAEGTLNKPERGEGWIGWRGEVCVPLDRVGGGGFVSDRVIVQDELVLTLDVPNMPTHVLPFRQAVPIRLTTDLAETSTAIRVTEVWGRGDNLYDGQGYSVINRMGVEWEHARNVQRCSDTITILKRFHFWCRVLAWYATAQYGGSDL
jgi:hypothetical protein